MSTRRKGGVDINCLLARRMDMSTVHDRFILPLRMVREALAAAEGSEANWGEMAGMINVCGIYSVDKKREDWLAPIMRAADAMRSIESRNKRVGGRWAATPEEVDAITDGLNIIDDEVLRDMRMPDFINIAVKVNNLPRDGQ